MAKRPIFISSDDSDSLVEVKEIEFEWHAGLSVSQKQKSIDSLHGAAQKDLNLNNILEISSKSKVSLGISLSAFNLKLRDTNNVEGTVETFFQGSKIFNLGGPYNDLYYKTPIEAKRDQRLSESGDLIAFNYENKDWPLSPATVFYDWLYCSALQQNKPEAEALLHFDAFSDIEFNPSKSINCQASSAALYKSMVNRNLIDEAMGSVEKFISLHKQFKTSSTMTQDLLNF
ncbi:hypothetical protein N9H80_01745 [Candidatus Pseudothioglobus singularis]|nr:hypothetical protein [Candidatus Pseudothioglobus singularis]